MTQVLPRPKPSSERDSARRAEARQSLAVCGFLVLAVALVFGRTLSQGFCNVDDFAYVYEEPHVSRGLSWSGLGWAFTNGPLGEWYPLSMLSHMLDCQLYGLNPAGHHLTNVLLHASSAVVLFLVLWRMTEALWPSALVAALFALHPLHVESVAWISERRDVLSGLFFMLTLGAYGEYVRHPRSLGRYLALMGFFALGLLAKPMLVTLPPLLLLLDVWPLQRLRPAPLDAAGPTARPTPFPWRVVVEKLPLFALAFATAGWTMLTHSTGRPNPLTLLERLEGAAVACVAYLGQLFIPVGLSVFYPHPEAGWPISQVASAVALLLAITVAALMGRRAYPYFFVGWFWYLGMLIPVLGLTSVGAHARADRYTYLSQIGLYLALVWGAMRLGASWPARRWVFGIGSALMLAALMACTWRQTGFWRDDKTRWQHAVACDPGNVYARYNLARALSASGDPAAEAQYRLALARDPNDRNIYGMVRAAAHLSLGDIANRKGDIADAIAEYEQSLEWDPNTESSVLAQVNLAGLLAKVGRFDEAAVQLRRASRLSPDNAIPVGYLAVVLALQGKTDEAIENYRKALAIDPNYGLAHANLATLLAQHNRVDEAIVHFRRAIEVDHDAALLCYQVAELLRQQGKTDEAAEYEQRGRLTSRRNAESLNRRGAELAKQAKLDEAIAQFQAAIAAAPDYAQAYCNLADALVKQGNRDAAIALYRQALDIDPNLEPAKQGLRQLSNR